MNIFFGCLLLSAKPDGRTYFVAHKLQPGGTKKKGIGLNAKKKKKKIQTFWRRIKQ